jgi:hypothetical protein
MSTLSTYPLRLPKSVKAEAEALCKADGTSRNQFVAIAVAEKIAVLRTAAFFEERRQRSTGKALDALLNRTDGEGVPSAPAAGAKHRAGKTRAPARKAAAIKRS